jgi:hypothetical protein
MSEKVNRARILELLKKAVDEKGADYVYPKQARPDGNSCVYVHKRKPSCIAGHVFHALGVPLKTLSKLEGNSVAGVLDPKQWPAGVRVKVELTPAAKETLGDAQSHQDNGYPWGEALAKVQGEYGYEGVPDV